MGEITDEKELLVDTRHVLQQLSRVFPDDLLDLFRLAIHADQPEVRRVRVASEVEKIAFGGDELVHRVQRVDQLRPLRLRDDRLRALRQRQKPHFVLPQRSLGNTRQEKVSVVRRLQGEVVSRQLADATPQTDVRRSRTAQTVEIHFLHVRTAHFDRRRAERRRRIARGIGVGGVENADVVRCPAQRGELRSQKNVVELLTTGDIEKVDRRPIRTGLRDTRQTLSDEREEKRGSSTCSRVFVRRRRSSTIEWPQCRPRRIDWDREAPSLARWTCSGRPTRSRHPDSAGRCS